MLGRVLKKISPQLAPIIQLIISLANRSDYLGKKNPEIIQLIISLANRSDYLGKKNPEIIQIFKKKNSYIPKRL